MRIYPVSKASKVGGPTMTAFNSSQSEAVDFNDIPPKRLISANEITDDEERMLERFKVNLAAVIRSPENALTKFEALSPSHHEIRTFEEKVDRLTSLIRTSDLKNFAHAFKLSPRGSLYDGLSKRFGDAAVSTALYRLKHDKDIPSGFIAKLLKKQMKYWRKNDIEEGDVLKILIGEGNLDQGVPEKKQDAFFEWIVTRLKEYLQPKHPGAGVYKPLSHTLIKHFPAGPDGLSKMISRLPTGEMREQLRTLDQHIRPASAGVSSSTPVESIERFTPP
ncbi:hypothetical protein PsorP6_003073 [Peronosclerospora sorghi]|uniref:Uncharacterized protein n=1 Tax=Peronosclerospora sorghi TaxID=230839 RepID=A0ACC0VPI4_9STRA|nr:hypothetical protein PsorP6_003073 [Peronosclerospora sorghi]